MIFREIIIFQCKNRTKEIITLWGQNTDIFTVTTDGFKVLVTKQLGVVLLTVTRILDP